MAKKLYIGNADNVARNGKKAYIGDEKNIARKIKKMYIGDANNIARLFFSGGKKYILVGGLYGDLTVSNEDDYNTITKLWPSMSSSAYTSNLVSKINGDIIVARGKDVTNGYGKYDPLTNTITVLPKLSTGVTLGSYTMVDMVYGNGYYFGIFYSEDANTYRVAYTTSLTEAWTPFSSSSSGYSWLHYHDGAFYLYANSAKAVRRYTGSPPTAGETSSEVVSSGHIFRGLTVFKGNVVVSVNPGADTYGRIYRWSASSSMPTGTITSAEGVDNVSTAVIPVCLTNASDRIIAVDTITNKLCYSMDGLTWTLVDTLSGLRAVYYENGVYYATPGSKIYMSSDLTTWTQISTGHGTPPFVSVRKHFICTEMEE